MYRRRSADQDEATARPGAPRAQARPLDASASALPDILALQGTAGNAAVARAMRGASVQRAGDAQATGTRPPQRLEGVLPRSDWWRAYLDPAHHEEARQKHPGNPGELYDHQQSPGYQSSMTAAYDQYLNSGDIGERVDFPMYQGMHNAVVSGLDKEFDPSGKGGYATSFPLRANSPTPSVLEEEIGGRHLTTKADEFRRRGIKPDALTWYGRMHGAPNVLIETLYKHDEVEKLVTEILDRLYAELDKAETDRDRFRAIGRAVRSIHIVHPYEDTNRRLNVHVLLPRLLLAAGFQPVVFKDMDQLFQGGRSLDQIADALERGQGLDLTSDDLVATAPQYERPWYENDGPPAAAQTQSTIVIPTFSSMQTPGQVYYEPAPAHRQASDDWAFDEAGGPGPAIVHGQDDAMGGPGPAIVHGQDDGMGGPGPTMRHRPDDAMGGPGPTARRSAGVSRAELTEYLVGALQQANPDSGNAGGPGGQRSQGNGRR
ncbi:hypothetical protein ABTY98_16045 [Streptomyces sp. NPDC096040]|uniref:hypothetical protein n=1 Tax=Streptomyces sp. NPDC096040 TaxID=3155541 RepID=UPI00331C41E0